MLDLIRTKIASCAGQLKSTRALRRFARQEDGATAVEFAMVATPFLALVFAIIETAIVFFSSQALETAVADSSRLIMTGQAQTAGFDQAAFKTAVCAKIFGLFDCQNGLYIDVKTFATFGDVTMPKPVDANKNFQNNFTYNPGVACNIVVVRLFYQWPVYALGLLGSNFSDMAGSKRLLTATAAFRNEPYGSTSCS
jgi:Flp pilus assembly protein TadG